MTQPRRGNAILGFTMLLSVRTWCIHRYLSNDASQRALFTPRGHFRGKVNPTFRRSAKGPLTPSAITPEAVAGKTKRLLEPHMLSQRIKNLCDELQLDAAVEMLKNAPKDAQSTPVWNTLIWEALKAERWNLAYKLYTDVGQPVAYHFVQVLTHLLS